MKKLILFDIDGTLLTLKRYISREVFADILSEIFEKEVDLSSIPNFAGMTDLQILSIVAENNGIEYREILDNVEEIWRRMLDVFKDLTKEDDVDVMPGILELVARLFENRDKYALGICTGNFRENAFLKLSACNLDAYFPFGAFGCDSSSRGDLPPVAIRRANEFLKTNEFDSSNTVIIGDAPLDIECARVNGIVSIIVATGFFDKEELAEHNPDYLFDDLTDTDKILSIIDEL